MHDGYRSAEDLFEAARDAGRERARALLQMERMDAARGLRAASFSERRGGMSSDGMAATVDFMDWTERMRGRIEDDDRLLGYATAVLYGWEGNGGVASLLSSLHADAVFWRYLADEPWRTCAACLGSSERVLQRACREAFDLCDALGFERAIDGVGVAED